MAVFYKDNDNKLFLVNITENEIPKQDKQSYLVIDETELPEALYPFYQYNPDTNTIIPDNDRILDKARKIAIENLEQEFEDIIAQGYDYNGIKLYTDFNDILKLKAGLDLAKQLNKDKAIVKDMDGNSHLFSLDEMNLIIVKLGLYYYQVWETKVELQKQVYELTDPNQILDLSIKKILQEQEEPNNV